MVLVERGVVKMHKPFKKYPSGFKFIDQWEKGFHSGIIYGFFGEPNIGKTLTTLHLASGISHNMALDGVKNNNILVYDTEGSAHDFVESWYPVLKKRFPKMGEIIVVYKFFIEDILEDHGVRMRMDYKVSGKDDKASGKQEAVILELIDEPFIDRVIRENNIGVVIYDSLTNPIATQFSTARQNFPARANVIGAWLGGIIKYMIENNTITFGTLHMTIDPANQYARPKAKGGNLLHYNIKRLYYISRLAQSSSVARKMPANAEKRKIEVYRHPKMSERGAVAFFYIDDEGIHDAE